MIPLICGIKDKTKQNETEQNRAQLLVRAQAAIQNLFLSFNQDKLIVYLCETHV